MASKYLSAVGDTMREMVNNRIRPCSFYNSVMSEWIYLPSSIKVCQFLQNMEKMKMSHTKLNLIPILYLFLETESPFYVKLYICWDQTEDLTSFDIYSICKPIQRQLSQKHSFSVLYKKKNFTKSWSLTQRTDLLLDHWDIFPDDGATVSSKYLKRIFHGNDLYGNRTKTLYDYFTITLLL